eukprot:3628541-Pleurochrysis_carterae.AAC.1
MGLGQVGKEGGGGGRHTTKGAVESGGSALAAVCTAARAARGDKLRRAADEHERARASTGNRRDKSQTRSVIRLSRLAKG